MAVIKCKMCGGELEIAEDLSICECEFCGTKQTIPKVKDENIQNLFNRANYLRMKAEFDKASETYEKIIQTNNEEAEAYWGLVLCKYGIEYVEDPATNKRIPTCHRASFDAVIADEDYKLAIQYADISQKSIYENEAKLIDEIQKGIVEIASHEESYDIFICYKETDADGRRTQDSVIANDIYYQLTQEGFKVFYAAITLEDKLGQEYEPYIFSALNSSKVMLTLGTKPEYFNAVWVKNEWSRFLKIMKKDRSRMLIPCYRDMDAYDLPEEFAHLQAQDMSKIGFINDLVRGIKKVVNKEEANDNASQVVVQASGYSANVMALLKRGTMALEDREWEKADGFFEEVLNQDAENGEAFLGKLLVENKCSDIEELKVKFIKKYEEATEGEKFEACDAKNDYISKQANLYKVLVYYEMGTIIKSYNYDRSYTSYHKNRMQQKEIQISELENDKLINRCKQYCENEAKAKLDNFLNSVIEALDKRIADAKSEDGKSVERITKEYEKFIEETDKSVAENNKKYTVELENEYNSIKSDMDKATTEFEYNEVKGKFAKLSGYKDTVELIKKCDKEIENIKDELERKIKDREKAKKKNLKVATISVVAVIIAIILVINVSKVIEYNSAIKLQKDGKYDKANEKFVKLGDFKDSEKQIIETKYLKAVNLKEKFNYDEAIVIFEELEDYKNSKELLMEIKYLKAVNLKEKFNYDEAIVIFDGLEDYKNSQELLMETKYIKALKLKEEKDYSQSLEIFNELIEYKDSKEQISEIKYLDAIRLNNAGNYSAAYEIFKEIEKDKNLEKELITKCLKNAIIHSELEVSFKFGGREYILIAKEDKKALLLSRSIVIENSFGEVNEWEKCSLRKWLNESYYEKNFLDYEKEMILSTVLDNDGSQNDTVDKVFLLSIEEYRESDCNPVELDGGDWWLRSKGRGLDFYNSNVVYVAGGGLAVGLYDDYGDNPSYTKGVRPAFWISLE